MSRKLIPLALVLISTAALAQERQESHRIIIEDVGGKRVFIGTGLTTLTPELREFFGAPREAGVLVGSLTENGPAAKAGLKIGDVITAVDGTPVSGSMELSHAMKGKHAGEAVRLDIIRNKKPQSVTVNVEERDVREFRRASTLPMLGRELAMVDGPEWRALLATPDNEDLRAQIRDLEKRLQDLEKKLKEK
jgi:C-terminal processing protease CtpA/Prc